MLVPINITGATYVSRSRPLSAQLTQNFYAEAPDTRAAKSPYVLHAFPGLTLFGNAPGVSRGSFEHNGVLYRVAGTTLYSVGPSGAHTSLGTIPGTARCIFDGIGSNVVLATQGKAYQYNGSTVAEITDADLETPNGVTHLNNQIVFDGDGGRFCSSDVGDATSIDGLNYASAESRPDDLVRAYAFNQILYLFGEKTTELWWNDGAGNPPFSRIEGGIHSVGLAAIHSVASNDKVVYWLADDSHVYRAAGQSIEQVSNAGIHREISELATISNAVGFPVEFQSQRFYTLVLPGANKSFVYSENNGEWYSWSSNGGRTFANSYAYVYRKNLVEDYRNGNIYELDMNAFTDNGEPQIRIRDTGPINGELLGAPGRKIEMGAFELDMETGQGTLSGQGITPKVALSFSDDGGKTFGTERWAELGRSGQFQHKVRWTELGSFFERIIRIRISDPVDVSIHSAWAEIEAGI